MALRGRGEGTSAVFRVVDVEVTGTSSALLRCENQQKIALTMTGSQGHGLRSGTGFVRRSIGNIVIGDGTTFIADLQPGATLVVGGQEQTISKVETNQSCVTMSQFNPPLAGELSFQPANATQMPPQEASEETNDLWNKVQFLSKVLESETAQKEEMERKVKRITGIEDVGGNLEILADVMPMLKDLNLQLNNGQLLGGQLPAEFESRITQMIASQIQANNPQGVLEALKTKAAAMDSTMSDEGRVQVSSLMGQLCEMQGQNQNSTKATTDKGSLMARAQAILGSKDLSVEARKKLEALTQSMDQTNNQVEKLSSEEEQLQLIQAQKKALEAKVNGFSGELSESNRSKVMQLMSVLASKEQELLAACNRPAAAVEVELPAPVEVAVEGEKQQAILRQIDAALSDPNISDATRVKLSSMRQMVVGATAVDPEPVASSSQPAHSTEVVDRARRALQDPDVPQEKKVFIARMLRQMEEQHSGATIAASEPAAPEPKAMPACVPQFQAERSEVELRARQALNDPNLPAAARQEIMAMLGELQTQANEIEALQELTDETESTSESQQLQSMHARCAEALANPDLPSSERAQIMKMQKDLEQHAGALGDHTLGSAAQQSQEMTARQILQQRALEALADPSLPEEKKAELKAMLSQISSQEERMQSEMSSLSKAEAEAAAMKEELHQAEQQRAALGAEVQKTMSDPSMSEESRSQLAAAYGNMVNESQMSPAGSEELQKAAELEAKCRMLLSADSVPEGKKEEIRVFLSQMASKREAMVAVQEQRDLVLSNSRMEEEAKTLAVQLSAQEAERDRVHALLAAAQQEQADLQNQVVEMRSQFSDVADEPADTVVDENGIEPLERGVEVGQEALAMAMSVLQDPNVDSATKQQVMGMVQELQSQMVEAEKVEELYAERQAKMKEMTAQKEEQADEQDEILGESLAQLAQLKTVRDQARAAAAETLSQKDLPAEVRNEIVGMLSNLEKQVQDLEQATMSAHQQLTAKKAEIAQQEAQITSARDALFAEVDANGDGVINKAEFGAAMKAGLLSQSQQSSNETRVEEGEQDEMVTKAQEMLTNPMVPDAMKAQIRTMLAQRQQALQGIEAAEAGQDDEEEDSDDEQTAMEAKMHTMLADPNVPEQMKSEVRAMLAQTQQLRQQAASMEKESTNTTSSAIESLAANHPQHQEALQLAQSILNDPNASPSDKQQVQDMLNHLQSQAEVVMEVENAAKQSESMGDSERLVMGRNLAEQALADPNMSEEAKVQIRALLAAHAPQEDSDEEEAQKRAVKKQLGALASRRHEMIARARTALETPGISPERKAALEAAVEELELDRDDDESQDDDDEDAEMAEKLSQAAELKKEMEMLTAQRAELLAAKDELAAAQAAQEAVEEEQVELALSHVGLQANEMLQNPEVPEQMKSEVRRVLAEAEQMEAQVAQVLQDPSVPEETKAKVRTMLAQAQNESKRMERLAVQRAKYEEEIEEQAEEELVPQDEVEVQAQAMLANPAVPEVVKAKVRALMLSAREADAKAKAHVSTRVDTFAEEEELAEAAAAAEDAAESALSEVKAVQEQAQSMLDNPNVPEAMKAEVRSMLAKAQHLTASQAAEQESDSDEDDVSEEADLLRSKMSMLASEKARLQAERESLEAQIRGAQDELVTPRDMSQSAYTAGYTPRGVQPRTGLAQSAGEAQIRGAQDELAADSEQEATFGSNEIEAKARAMLNNPLVPEEMKVEVRAMLGKAQQLREEVGEEVQEREEGMSEVHEMEAKARAMLDNPTVPEGMKAQVRSMLAQSQNLRQQAVEAASEITSVQEATRVEEGEQDEMVTKAQEMLTNPMVPDAMKAQIRTMLAQRQQALQGIEAAEAGQDDEEEESDDEDTAMEAKMRAMLADPNVPEQMKSEVRAMLAQTQQLRQQAATMENEADELREKVAEQETMRSMLSESQQERAQAAQADQSEEEETDSEQAAMEAKMRAMLSNPMVPEHMKSEIRTLMSQQADLLEQVQAAKAAVDETNDESTEEESESEEDEEQAQLMLSQMDQLAAERNELLAAKQLLESQISEAQKDFMLEQGQVEAVLSEEGSDDQLKVMQEAQTILADPSIPDAMKIEVQAMLTQLTSARSQMFNAASSLSETQKLHEEAVAEGQVVNSDTETAGREVTLLEQLAQLEGEREQLLQMRSTLQSSMTEAEAEVEDNKKHKESDEEKLMRLQGERQRSAAAGMSIEEWRKKWNGTTLSLGASRGGAPSPTKRPASLDVSECDQRATGSVSTGEEATLVERAAGLSIHEKQELAEELRLIEQVQSLSRQQREQFASKVSPADDAAGAQVSAQKFAEIQGLCKDVVSSDISDDAKLKIQGILNMLTGEFPQLQSQTEAPAPITTGPVHRLAPSAPSPITASPQQAENNTAPSESVSMLMNQLSSVQSLLTQLQSSSSEGSLLEQTVANFDKLPHPEMVTEQQASPHLIDRMFGQVTTGATPPITPVRMMPVQHAMMVPRASPFTAYQGMPVISAPVTPRDMSQSAYTGYTPRGVQPRTGLAQSAGVARIDRLRQDQAQIEQLASSLDAGHAGLMSSFRSSRPPY